MRYSMVYWKDGDWYVGRIKERPDVFSQGETLTELEENLKEALALMEECILMELPPDYKTKELIIEAQEAN